MARPVDHVRYDLNGPLRKMGVIEGYAMICRPQATPFVLKIADWESLPTSPPERARDR